MSQKKIKLQKRLMSRYTGKMKQKGMEELVDFILSMDFRNRLDFCWNVLRKKRKELV